MVPPFRYNKNDFKSKIGILIMKHTSHCGLKLTRLNLNDKYILLCLDDWLKDGVLVDEAPKRDLKPRSFDFLAASENMKRPLVEISTHLPLLILNKKAVKGFQN